MTPQEKEAIIQTVKDWRPELRVLDVKQLTSDASPRRYFRIDLDRELEDGNRTVVAMLFDSLVSPDSGAAAKINANEAYVELTRYLVDYNYPVPALYHGGPHDMILIIEDLSDTLLIASIVGEARPNYSASEVDRFYRDSVELIVKLQQIPAKKEFFPYQRFFDKNVYIKEMGELTDYVLAPVCSDLGVKHCVELMFEQLGTELEALSRVLVHRDFHSWNLLLDYKKRVRVIDFQDALMAPRCYDLMGLINDRDTDAALGEDRYRMLLKHFWETSGMGDDFWPEFDRVALQRDLKVAGRFNKLNQVRGLSGYLVWVPGTLYRIGRTLSRMTKDRGNSGVYSDALKALSSVIPEISAGAKKPEII